MDHLQQHYRPESQAQLPSWVIAYRVRALRLDPISIGSVAASIVVRWVLIQVGELTTVLPPVTTTILPL